MLRMRSYSIRSQLNSGVRQKLDSETIMLRRLALIPLVLGVLFVGCVPPELPVVHEKTPVIVGVDSVLGFAASDSIFWYTGYRPDSVIVDRGVLRLAMPSGSVGQRLYAPSGGCVSPAIPLGAVRSIARSAWGVLGHDARVREVVVTVEELELRTETWYGRRSCHSGPAMIRLELNDLQTGN